MTGAGIGSCQGRRRTGSPFVATRTVGLVVLAAMLPLGLAAQDTAHIALLRGLLGVEPRPGSLLATPARLEIARLPLSEALSRLAERSRVQVAFSPSLLPAHRHVDCECTSLNMARTLDRLLAGTDLGYVELGSQVVVVPRLEPGFPGADENIRSPVHAVTTLTGVVRDSANLEPVAFARVTATPLGSEAVAAAVSDRYGAFVMPSVPASVPVRVDAGLSGYAWTRTYDTLPTDPIRVLLGPAPIDIEGLDVVGSDRPGDPISLSRDGFVIDSALIRSLPTILEADILGAASLSAMASATSDYASLPFIRGGTSDGTPVLLDGMRLFNAFHLGGFIAAINPELVERTRLLAGSGGEAVAIGSLSGAIDIATRDGSREAQRMAGSLGLSSSRFSVEGPVGESVSYMVGGRRAWLDGLTQALARNGVIDDHFPYSFGDLHAKVTTDLGGVRRLSVTGYLNSESDGQTSTIPDQEIRERAYTLRNATFSAHYRDRLGANGIVDANLGHSGFTSDLLYQEQTLRPLLPPDVRLVGDGSMSEARADLRVTWHPGRATIMAGSQATRFQTRHEYAFLGPVDGGNAGYITRFLSPLNLRASQWRLAAYTSVQVPLRAGFSTRAGLRIDRFQGLATTLAPFAELDYVASWWHARITGSRSYQALSSLRNEEALTARIIAYDLLVPVRATPVPRNTEFSIGWEGSRGGLRVRLDAYTRTLDHLRLPDPEAYAGAEPVLRDPSLWAMAKGVAQGFEASWSWIRARGISVLGSYRWASVSRTVGSQVYTPRFHRDHELELGSSYRHGASSWSARVSLRSGQPDTPWLAVVTGREHLGGWIRRVLLAGEYNSAKLPPYARIDVGWRREIEVSRFGGGSVVPYVSVANLLNRSNVVGWRTSHKRRRYKMQLPIIPSIGAEFRF